ncbi:50S ribosomal protein L30 [Marnyiella aurantia]|uniref:Large ribosomal subunit protein uL30 n=1 Tax=Marnyiella aurantia TaxID=2758037 RepID=A0A7D7QJZ5_9FLAO|nr:MULTISPECIES: 50S ribosomal protein L30 [Weeksellaceae]MBA5246787.1 50S ribosomal protein L30 [Marnyiella aurantia]MBP0612130.1 50S ribosomal protein L30 [Marnyiella aurantia]MDF0719443.1 50S ribosomal protein L30 [Kaistella sp. PBT33-4]QFG52319.1 50S ribosomal protein L30 [Chryseobacterium sp.]QMS97865.1 50S ribosomal protein L30 [Marnyiella aurantia]
MATIKVKQVRSAINRTKTQKRTLEALGLKRLHQVVTHEASPAVLGMVAAVRHLVEVQEEN